MTELEEKDVGSTDSASIQAGVLDLDDAFASPEYRRIDDEDG